MGGGVAIVQKERWWVGGDIDCSDGECLGLGVGLQGR